MQCYTSTFNGLVRGILYAHNPEGGAIRLGEKGPRRHLLEVPFSRQAPPQKFAEEQAGYTMRKVLNATFAEAFRAREGRAPVRHWVLARSNGKDSRFLVRVKTVAPYTPYTHGHWETVEGSPEVLAKGWGAHGAGGVMGTWDDGLIVMSPGDVLRVHPEGLSAVYLLSHVGESLEQVKDETPPA